jgi:hypothetical protein
MFEYLVRPYQSPSSQGSVIIPSTPTAPSEKATLTWGATAPMPPFQGVNFTVVACQEQSDEQSRKTDRLQIMGQDGESYVWVERTHQATLFKAEKVQSEGPPGSVNYDQYAGSKFDTSGDLAPFANDIGSAAGGNTKKCVQTWNLKNNTTAG